MEQFLIGLRDFAIEKVVSRTPPVFEARWTGKNTCPHCAGEKLRIKDSFWRTIRNISIHGRASRLLIRCHKYRCEECVRYFNTRLAGIKVWRRTTELLKRNIFHAYNKGISCKEIADEHRIGVASVECYYHQMMQHTSSHWQTAHARAFWVLMSTDLRADRALQQRFATWPAAGYLTW